MFVKEKLNDNVFETPLKLPYKLPSLASSSNFLTMLKTQFLILPLSSHVGK